MDLEEVYNNAYDATLKKIAANENNIPGGIFAPTVDKAERSMPQSLEFSEKQEKQVAPMLKERAKQKTALNHPALTGIPTLGIWPAVASEDTKRQAIRKLRKKNPGFAKDYRKASEKDREIRAKEDLAKSQKEIAQEEAEKRRLMEERRMEEEE